MEINFDSSLDEIEKIIPSPKINKNTKDLFSEEESKSNLDLKDNNLDSFSDISQINNEEEDNSLNIKNNIKNSKLPSTNENTENSKKTKIHQTSEEIIKCSNEINFLNFKNNIQSDRINNNEKKYQILFDKNKQLNIKSLREEYNKIKNDMKEINTEYKPNYNKRYINIFNNNKQKLNSNIRLNFENKKERQNRNIILQTNNDFDDINFQFNFKTNNNSKQKETYDKINNFKKQLLKEDLISEIKIHNKIWENKNKSILNLNNINYNNSKLHMNNINKKNKEKKFYIFEEYKANSSNNNLKLHTTKSTVVEYDKNNNNKNDHKINLFSRYNKLCSGLFDEKNNSKINSKASLNKISESNKIEKLDNDFNTMYNMVENKIRKNKMEIKLNEENQRYCNKTKFSKIIPKLLSISQNEPVNNYYIKNSNRNNLFNNNYKLLYRNNIITQINQEVIKPYSKGNKIQWNNYIISDFNLNQYD